LASDLLRISGQVMCMCWRVVLLHTLVSSSDAHRGYICLLNWGGFESGCVHVLAGCFVGYGSVSSFDECNGLRGLLDWCVLDPSYIYIQ
jgi:hypothetical protein